MPDGPLQLPLPLPHAAEYGRDSFVRAPSNADALALVERWPDWPAPVAVLSGPPGSGKTHLAHIWAERAGAGWLAASELLGTDALASWAGGSLAVEDVPTHAPPEQALFHLANLAKETGAGLLLTARAPAAEWRVQLPDLRSRLRMATPAELGPPDDQLLRTVLVKLFADRQLTVERPVIDYLLTRMERSLNTALAIVDALDRAALAGGHRITRPLAAATLAQLAGAAEGSRNGHSLSS
jgi:chromosomal replication initiation ATPase DnaA